MTTKKTVPAKTPRTSTRTAISAKKAPSANAVPKKKDSTAKATAPLTSPRVTKAAANALKALAPLTPAVAKSAKPALAKKPKAVAKPKASAPAAAARVTSAQAQATTSATAQSIKSTPVSTATAAQARLASKPVTTIEAFIDVGFGNRLTLRGEGAAGLSWERGLTMNCLGSAEWAITLEGDTDAPLTFKFLLNDERWSLGENYTLAPGKTGAFTPEFGA